MNPYRVSPEEFLKNSRLPVRVLPTEADMYEEMAEIIVSAIVENNGRAVVICPVGPIGQYPVLARKINERRISLRDVWFLNMDEYLDGSDRPIPASDPLSFHGIMERLLYSQIDPELVMPPEQRLFPEPGQEAQIDRLLEELGGADCCLTGVGINGHIAFNEPPAAEEPVSDEEFRSCGTRCLDISRETIVNNGAHKIHGALDIFPRHCITLGMKQLLAARNLKIYLYCDWQWGIMRKIALEEPSRFAPASFLQLHPNSEMVITEELLHMTLDH